MAPQTISVIGALNADFILVMNRMPEVGESIVLAEYYEALGGKGANSAIAAYRTCHTRPVALDSTNIAEPKDTGESKGPENVPLETPVLPSVGHWYDAIGHEGIAEATRLPVREVSFENIEVRMVGAVGDDQYAEIFETELKKNGIDTSGVVKLKGIRSSMGFNLVEQYTGDNRCIVRPGALHSWKPEHFLEVRNLSNGPRPDLVVAQMEIDKDVVQQMIETAGNAGIDFLLNAAPAAPIMMKNYRFLTHLLVNESEAAILSGRDLHEVNRDSWSQIAQEFVERGVQNVVLTLGAQGAYFATATESDHVPGYKVHVVDATGAGDTFTGAYASEYLRQKAAGKWDIRSAIVRANKASAIMIGEWGCQDGIPWADDIEKFDAELNAPEGGEVII